MNINNSVFCIYPHNFINILAVAWKWSKWDKSSQISYPHFASSEHW